MGAAATPIPSPGNSNTSICEGIDGNTPFVFHAFKWQDGVVTDLGSLPGPDNCSVATSINEDGEITGYSENGLTDPLTGIRESARRRILVLYLGRRFLAFAALDGF